MVRILRDAKGRLFRLEARPAPARSPVTAGQTQAGLAMFVWVIRRFGLLAIFVQGFTSFTLGDLPTTAASWYAPLALTPPLLIAAAGTSISGTATKSFHYHFASDQHL